MTLPDRIQKPAAQPLPPPMTEDEELIGRRSPAYPAPVPGDEERARGLEGEPPPPPRLEVGPPARQPPPIKENESPAPRSHRPTGQPPGGSPEASNPAAGSSARAALDDLEAKGLFLVRQSPALKSQAPGRPEASAGPSKPAPVESDWSLFAPQQTVPGGSRHPEPPLPSIERPAQRHPEPGFRAADELVDRLDGRVRTERYSDFQRRFERPGEPHKRAVDTLFPRGVVKLFEARAWQKLIEGFQRVIPSAPEEPAAWIGLAICALAQKDVSTSARLLDHALKMDDEFKPDRLLAEVLPDQPKDLLRLAEELARLGHLEPAQELCHQVAGDLDRDQRLRRRAQRVRQKVRQEYYLRRGECDPEKLARPVPWTRRALRALGSGLLILGCLGLAAGAYVKATTTYHLDRGQTKLAQSAYHLARLQSGDRSADRRGPVEGHLEEALHHFAEVRRWQPANLRATYLTAVATEMVVAAGRTRRSTELRWDAARWEAARKAQARAAADLQSLHLSPEQTAAEAQAWEAIRREALRGQGLGY